MFIYGGVFTLFSKKEILRGFFRILSNTYNRVFLAKAVNVF